MNHEKPKYIAKAATVAFIPLAAISAGCAYTPQDKTAEKTVRQQYSELSQKYTQGQSKAMDNWRP